MGVSRYIGTHKPSSGYRVRALYAVVPLSLVAGAATGLASVGVLDAVEALAAAVLLAAPWLRKPQLTDLAGGLGVVLAFYTVPAALHLSDFSRGTAVLRTAVLLAAAAFAGGRAAAHVLGGRLSERKSAARPTNGSRTHASYAQDSWQLAALVASGIAVILIALYFAGSGGLRARLAVGYGGSGNLASQGLGPFAAGFDLLFLACAVGIADRIRRGGRMGLWLLPLLLMAVYSLRIGSRGYLLELAMAVLVTRRLVAGRLRIGRRWVVLGGTIGLSALAVLGLGRFVLNSEGTSAALRYGVSNFSLGNLDLRNSPEFTYPIESITSLAQDPNLQWLYGTSWLRAATDIIPSSVLGNNQALADEYVHRYYYSMYESGGGRGLSPVTEGYWNLGYAGVIIELFFYGFTSEKLSLWLRGRFAAGSLASPLLMATIAIAWAWIFSLARIDFQTASRGIVTRLLLPALLIYVIQRVGVRRRGLYVKRERPRQVASAGRP
jgi:oligosaccharide repeat unit polymerase